MTAVRLGGALFGGNHDVGAILGSMPKGTEEMGRINGVGIGRQVVEGSIAKFGMFTEYSEDAEQFDTDPQLIQHYSTEIMEGAIELYERRLRVDLITNAGTIGYAGGEVESDGGRETASADEAGVNSMDEITQMVNYGDIQRLNDILEENLVPRQKKMFTGTRMEDTRTLEYGRVMFVPTKLVATLKRMKDFHGEPAWIPVSQYGAGVTPMMGEEGTVGNFRVVAIPTMEHWKGAGAKVKTVPDPNKAGGTVTAHNTDGRLDVFPMLVVGEDSFNTIGFQFSRSGKGKFRMRHCPPGEKGSSLNRMDPYGQVGFMSLMWWYGLLINRSERLAVLKTAAAA